MNNYMIRQIHPNEYTVIRKLDREAFESNERDSDGDFHEVFADNIRRSPYYIPELNLIAITDDGIYLGHAIFSVLPMGNNGERIVWLNSLAVKHDSKDDHTNITYKYQRKGIGTALVMRSLKLAKSLGYIGCMTCGHPDVYRKKMGFSDYRDFGIIKDASVDDPDGAIHAIELVPGGFGKTNKLLSYTYYDFSKKEEIQIDLETLKNTLTKMLGSFIIRASYQTERLHGGTVGEVRLVKGIAVTADNEKIPYKFVLKIQKKWERHGDLDSWHREYDLYVSDFGTLFTDSLRWPECYCAEINIDETETRLWIEYIDGISGKELTVEMFECVAYELGRWQGKLYAEQPKALQNIHNLSRVGDLKDYYLHYCSWNKVYEYIRADKCEIPKHLCEMLIEVDEKSNEIWANIEALPIVICHRDFWITNIFYSNGKIILIDWDTTGWGYMGEDIKSLIADEADVSYMAEYYRKCVPAYYKGFSEYTDISCIGNDCVREMILVNIGYRLVEWYMDADSPERKSLQIDTLQKIYEMRAF